MAAESRLLIKLADIQFAYPGGEPVLSCLDFELRDGERVGLTGPNGSGKTTFFHLIVGLLKPSRGQIEAFGRRLENEADFIAARRRIGLLFQDADDQLFFPTVLEDVAFGPLNLGKSPAQAREIAQRTLAKLGLQGFEKRLIHRLSGGEKKLVSLATLLAMEPEVLLLDEPTNGLDEKTRNNFLEILKGLEISYIIISHEIDFLEKSVQALFALADGRILGDDKITIHRHLHAHPHGSLPHRHDG
ncbi:MAG: ABC transporter ATP-binding protein [Desulfuromonadaceae bacterium]|nr:ABC transporter ATP-binding protein [Desulfuromonadaceae bacterium]